MKKSKIAVTEHTITVHGPLRRGARRLRIALVGLPGAGKTTLFEAISSTAVQQGELTETHRIYRTCSVQIGLEEASVVLLPSLNSVLHLQGDDLGTLKYLLWGNDRPPITAHEPSAPPAPFEPPDLIIQVVDAAHLQSHLALAQELCQLGRPVVLALNHMDQVRRHGLHINIRTLSTLLGVPVVPTSALLGQGLSALFKTAMATAHRGVCQLPSAPSPHIARSLMPLQQALHRPDIYAAFRVPPQLLLMLFATRHGYFEGELGAHFAAVLPALQTLRDQVSQALPRPLTEEIRADAQYQAATLYEAALRPGPLAPSNSWRFELDAFLLHPKWGLVSSLLVFAAVLFVVFEVSGWIDQHTTARLAEATSHWQPSSTLGVVERAVLDGLLGLTGIVVPYMLPLLLLLIALEDIGLMQRIAFVVDRGFHKIGLHGGVAVPFLLGLGCNVPALSAVARTSSGRERLIASVLITFVPCSARSAIILAVAGKYLGAAGVMGMYALTLLLLTLMGLLLSRQTRDTGPGQVQEISPLSRPGWGHMLHETWLRSSDVLTIVTPLLVGGSVVLALLSHWGADASINTLLTPLTVWWLGLPLVLGLPLLFGVLRKELSLLMIFQALGTTDIDRVLSQAQIITLLVFITFYVPCISTFAVMHKTLGADKAWFSVAVSVAVAMLLSLTVRIFLSLFGL